MLNFLRSVYWGLESRYWRWRFRKLRPIPPTELPDGFWGVETKLRFPCKECTKDKSSLMETDECGLSMMHLLWPNHIAPFGLTPKAKSYVSPRDINDLIAEIYEDHPVKWGKDF